MTPRIAAAQWRIDPDRPRAARAALAAGADQLYLDFGGADHDRRLDRPDQLSAAIGIAERMAVPVLAVNHVSDLGFAGPAAARLLEAALECGLALGVRAVHIPLLHTRSAEQLASARATLSWLCERTEGTDVSITCDSALNAQDSVAFATSVGHPALRIVLDTGNLVEAGHDIEDFAGVLHRSGLLRPDIHMRDPQAGGARGAAVLSGLVPQGVVGSVLVKNDYRANSGLLEADISRCRSFFPRCSKTVRLPL